MKEVLEAGAAEGKVKSAEDPASDKGERARSDGDDEDEA